VLGYHVKYNHHAAVGPTSLDMTDVWHRMRADVGVELRTMELRCLDPDCVEPHLENTRYKVSGRGSCLGHDHTHGQTTKSQ